MEFFWEQQTVRHLLKFYLSKGFKIDEREKSAIILGKCVPPACTAHIWYEQLYLDTRSE